MLRQDQRVGKAERDIKCALVLCEEKWALRAETRKEIRELRLKQNMADHAVIGGKIADMKLYDAADVAPTGEAFPQRQAQTLRDHRGGREEGADEMEDEDREETRRRKEDLVS